MHTSVPAYRRHRFPSEIISHCFSTAGSSRDWIIDIASPLKSSVIASGSTLDILVQSRRDQKAAKKFFLKLLKGLRYVPRVLITDKLKSYHAAKQELMPSVEHRQDQGQNNRAENSHQRTRLRERVMRRLKSAGQAQRFLSAFGIITSHFQPGRRLCTSGVYRALMKRRFAAWEQVVGAPEAA